MKKRHHKLAKVAGITRIGCYAATRDAVREGCKKAAQESGLLIEPRDVLRIFSGMSDLFRDVAQIIGRQKGCYIEIRLSELRTGELQTVSYIKTDRRETLPAAKQESLSPSPSKKMRQKSAPDDDNAPMLPL